MRCCDDASKVLQWLVYEKLLISVSGLLLDRERYLGLSWGVEVAESAEEVEVEVAEEHVEVEEEHEEGHAEGKGSIVVETWSVEEKESDVEK